MGALMFCFANAISSCSSISNECSSARASIAWLARIASSPPISARRNGRSAFGTGSPTIEPGIILPNFLPSAPQYASRSRPSFRSNVRLRERPIPTA
jgi:hypothetical protein